MPSMPNSIGSTMTAATWNTSVRRNEMSAETSPLVSAVKNNQRRTWRIHEQKAQGVQLVALTVVPAEPRRSSQMAESGAAGHWPSRDMTMLARRY